MKKLNNGISAIISRLCVAVLALLGYSCSEAGSEPDMYGTPTGTFEAKGAVTDEDGAPVKDAEVKVTLPDVSSSVMSLKDTKTNNSGNYEMTGETLAAGKLKVVCIPPDDELLPDSILVDLKYTGKSDSWYRGKASFTADFKLKKKQ